MLGWSPIRKLPVQCQWMKWSNSLQAESAPCFVPGATGKRVHLINLRRLFMQSCGDWRMVRWDASAGHSLQTTALVSEAYLRMVDFNRMRWATSGTSMISLCQEAKGLPTRSGGARRSITLRSSQPRSCLSARVPAVRRTRHPFAVSGPSGEPSQKIEFVFSCQPRNRRCRGLRRWMPPSPSPHSARPGRKCAANPVFFFRNAFLGRRHLLAADLEHPLVTVHCQQIRR